MLSLTIQHGARLVLVIAGTGSFLTFLLGDHPGGTDVTLIIAAFILVTVGCVLPHIEEISGGGMHIRTRNPDLSKLGEDVERIREEKPDPESVDLAGDDSWDGARYRLGERTLEWLLSDLTSHLTGCEARVFLYDEDVGKLMPAYRPPSADDRPPLGWEIGQGVTGRAYQRKQYEMAKWLRTHDDSYGLTDEMKARYADLTAVAAVPLFDQSGRILGTLSLSSREPATKLLTDLGYSEHLALAEQVAVILVDLLQVTA